AAIQASSVFGITLAILAGLIFAWVFKVVLLTPRKEPPPPPEPMVPLTVATFNIRDKQKVLEVKTVNLPRSEYEARLKGWQKRFGKDAVPLQGNQPLNRTTKEPINAEEPFFESQLEKYDFAPSLSSKLAPGHRAVTLTLPVDKCSGGLIRANDIV